MFDIIQNFVKKGRTINVRPFRENMKKVMCGHNQINDLRANAYLKLYLFPCFIYIYDYTRFILNVNENNINFSLLHKNFTIGNKIIVKL
jgi:hypothetical protein